jgi:ribonuclease D
VSFSASPDSIHYQLVTDDAALAACCARWQAQPALALDTEFMRVSTFYPQAALFQVADDHGIALIDPLAITDWSPLRAILTDRKLIIVMYSF